MKTPARDPAPDRYRIGAVARLTGIALPTLRVWERRYQAVSPQRTPKWGRVYSREDIARLSLLRAAVDAGHAIGTVAALSNEALERRLAEAPMLRASQTCRIAAAGPKLPQQLRALRDHPPELIATAEQVTGLGRHLDGVVDALLIECAAVLPDQASAVLELVERHRPRCVIMIYELASARVLRVLEGAGVLALRGPLAPAALMRLALSLTGAQPPSSFAEPPRPRFSAAQLERIRQLRSSVRCECPQHLTQVLTAVGSFEQYSADCENLDERDRALHRLLRYSAGQARALLEQALVRLLEAEGLAPELT
jgi:MerR family transcriptional regulator, light-induced transcriptional regulator